MKLFRYIAGVNKQQQEVEMTVPVISRCNPWRMGKCTKKCASTSQRSSKKILQNQLMRKSKLREEMADREAELMMDHFYTAGYDSPMKFWNRRNEVMFEKKNNEVDTV